MRILLVPVLALTACASHPPHRPAGLPASATWVGKGDKGRFVEIGARSGVYWTLTVFDAKGVRNPTTRWQLQGFARASLEPEEIVGFEDGALVLNDGSHLIPAL